MSFSPLSLARISKMVAVGSTAGLPQSQQCALWLYASDDAAATIETAGYFNSARALLRVGDVILTTCANSGTPILKVHKVLTVPASGNVTIGMGSVTAG
jgi:hypothetical protein